jgi:hypothetical protein
MSTTSRRPRSLPRSRPAPVPDVLAQAAALGAGLVAPRQLFEGFLAHDSLDELTEGLARSRDQRHPDAAAYEQLVGDLRRAMPADHAHGLLQRLESVWLERMACASEVGFLAGLEAGRAALR